MCNLPQEALACTRPLTCKHPNDASFVKNERRQNDCGLHLLNTSKFLHTYLPLALLLLAVMEILWLTPLLQKLPRDYVAETKILAKCFSRDSPTAAGEQYESIVRRRDQTLSSDATHSLIQGDAHWATPEGEVIFEVLSLYGVDRRTRENLPQYGSQSRTGQYFFPPGTEKKTYGQWDPMYAGPRVASYDHTEQFRGFSVYVFNIIADGIDETSGYEVLPDVPERYRAITYGKGKLWLEPRSGIIVDYEDAGISYFVEPATGEHVAEIFHWNARFTPDTRKEQFQLALRERFWRVALERGIPLALLAGGMLSVVLATFRTRRSCLDIVS
ncbi:MAG: hypothetical protein QOG67_2259 [Verrucomicrobiota bacterium]